MILILAGSAFVLGAIIGSFLATLVVRWPRHESVVGGRSQCDSCKRPLEPVELIPLLSGMIYRGRCRTCGAVVDPTHPAIEWSCAAIGAISLAVSPDFTGVALAILGWILVPLAVLDWRHMWLPNILTGFLAASGLLLGGFLAVPITDRLIGMVAGFGALWTVATVYRQVRHREGLGRGDFKLMGAIGAWLGWVPLAPVLALAAALGLAVAILRNLQATAMLPFGSMLAIAAWLAALAQVVMV